MLRVAAVLALLLVAGCQAPTQPASPATPPSVTSAPVAATADPVSITIPSIGVVSPPLLELGLDPAGALEVPPVDQPGIGGWYADGIRPGDPGPAVLAAHVNGRVAGKSVPGLFARLAEVKVGDLVHIDRVDGSRVTFKVTDVASYPKSRFPTAQVYGDIDHPGLRMITCGGAFDPKARSYLSNVVAYGSLEPG